ncbi:MAG: metal-dependent transcriptional regulator [Lachnospiraceae bacterium]|nr:metal-dependent transcriptional regulator [Candidatus Equihabitans merdae]
MQRTESKENYLETILRLSQKKPVVRSVDIAAELGFSKPSVSLAMKTLREAQLITVSPEGYITLTEEGRAIADTIYERHVVISDMLTFLGVPADIAEEDACRIEHVISEETFQAIKKHGSQK